MPTLADLEQLAGVVVPPIVQGVVGTKAVGKAVGNLSQGATAATGTLTDAQSRAQGTLDAIHGQNTNLLTPLQSGGSAATATSAKDTALLQPFQPGGQVSTDTTDKNAGLLAPYQNAGPTALSNAQRMVNDPSYDFTKDPSYQWRLSQGEAAINAGAAATGNRISGASLKALNDYAGGSASQEFQNAFGRQMGLVDVGQRAATTGVSTNLAEAQREQGAAGMGVDANLTEAGQQQNATLAGVNANTQYGAQTVGLTTETAKAVADLQTQKASALAAGDIAKANQIDSTISSITQGLTNQKSLASLKDLVHPSTPTSPMPGDPNFVGPVQGGPGASAGTAYTGMGDQAAQAGDTASRLPDSIASSAALGAPAIGTGVGMGVGDGLAIAAPEIGMEAGAAAGAAPFLGAGAAPLGATGALAAPDIAAPALAADASAGGMMSSVGAFLTNPVTIGVAAAAIAAYALIKHSQVHPTANKWVQGFQNPFDKQMGALNDHFIQAANSGQLTKAQAVQIRNTVKTLSDQYGSALKTFSAKGGKEKTVATQAQKTADEEYGPNFSKTLDAMDARIAGLAA